MRAHPLFLALVIACASGAPAVAQTAPGADTSSPATPATAAPETLSDKALAAESGQGVTNTVLSDQQLSATNSGNSVVASVMHTGDVAFSNSALTGFAGVGNFVVNTGNNSNLQGTISVNIVTNAPPL
jgi:hypothetical protein